MKISVPTPIQRQSIPAALSGKDIMGIAQTGTGKTLAFGIPLVERLDRQKGSGLILLPTRELAAQALDTIGPLGRVFGLSTALLIGGESIRRQVSELARRPRIILATPGRLIDHLQQRTINLSDVKILVLDEADRMLDMGFMPQIKKILAVIPPPSERQTLVFSATMPSDVVHLATAHMKLPVRVEVAPAGTTVTEIDQEIVVVNPEAKVALLLQLLQEQVGPTLIFTRTKRGATRLTQTLKGIQIPVAEIHADRSQSQRRLAMAGFRSGRFRILVATDIAARGIDVEGITLVVNYDLPDKTDDYVHRIGRTGRAGRKGRAISFATPDQGGDIRAIERLIRKTILVKQFGPATLQATNATGPSPKRSGGGRPGGGRFGGGGGRGRSGGGGGRSGGGGGSGNRGRR